MADTTKKELNQETINKFKENYTSVINDSLEIATQIDEKNPDLDLAGKLSKTIDNEDSFMDMCDLISDYDVKKNKFTNEDLYKSILNINKED